MPSDSQSVRSELTVRRHGLPCRCSLTIHFFPRGLYCPRHRQSLDGAETISGRSCIYVSTRLVKGNRGGAFVLSSYLCDVKDTKRRYGRLCNKEKYPSSTANQGLPQHTEQEAAICLSRLERSEKDTHCLFGFLQDRLAMGLRKTAILLGRQLSPKGSVTMGIYPRHQMFVDGYPSPPIRLYRGSSERTQCWA